jgi:predicted amidohydrolase
VRVGLLQVASPLDEPVEQRRDRVASMLRGRRDLDMVVLPELWAAGYFAFDRHAEHAEPLEGPTVEWGRSLARELDAWIHVGSFVERAPSGRHRNTAALVAPDGRLAHSYSKIHVFGYKSREAEMLEPGDRLGMSPTPLGVLGSTTCYDLRFPELWRAMVDQGVQGVAVPAAWPAARLGHWQLFTTARAVEEQVFVLACNACGEQDGVALAGHSRVVDPWGEVLVEAGDDEGLSVADLDPGLVERVRTEFPVLRDRLADYSALSSTN